MRKKPTPTDRRYLGRPALPAAERLSKSIPVRLTDELRAAVIEDSDRRGMRLGAWIRAAIVEKLAIQKALKRVKR